ncbi:MAG: YihY/virulence factor BrkB family protein [Verrucomicrobia bacterium]|nr:YihY/virulence factor BrkB family protein [Verrucomicrobiota bacterium]MCG2681966.1 YihY/virulence factor BrkB family protein [Kiritimatiellia bacterium]MBU4248442.1 YihY/virulence factor BrkB family protein [Verrucomicrobiota bacterium]MBU4292344.1 YihY/virulence factor BrkB family protein [Verrucomicrobiota bacterium]MBU4430027.1 YihY/virulence factor BrkB family protein [Verrucomicrobiota bacterium]
MSFKDIIRTTGLVITESLKSFLRNEDLQKAATAAYYSFLAIIPLCLLVIVVTGHLVFSSDTAMKGLEEVVGQISPVAAPVVLNEVTVLAQHRTWGLLSILILFWSVTPLASALRSAFSDIFKIRPILPFWSTKFFDIVSVLVLVTLLILLTLEKAYSPVLSHWLKDLPIMVRAANTVVPLILAMAALWLFYTLLIPVRLKPVHWLAGSTVTLLLLSLVGPGFALILRVNPNYGFTFGSLKMVFLLFIWVYYSFAVVLFGTEVMANVWRKDALVLKRLLLAPKTALKTSALLNRFVRTFSANEVICREDDTGNEMFFILSGAVAISKQGRHLLTMKPGDYFGELSMLMKAPRTATAIAALPETAVAVISRQNFDIVLGENPGLVLNMLQEMAARLKSTTAKLE